MVIIVLPGHYDLLCIQLRVTEVFQTLGPVHHCRACLQPLTMGTLSPRYKSKQTRFHLQCVAEGFVCLVCVAILVRMLEVLSPFPIATLMVPDADQTVDEH